MAAVFELKLRHCVCVASENIYTELRNLMPFATQTHSCFIDPERETGSSTINRSIRLVKCGVALSILFEMYTTP